MLVRMYSHLRGHAPPRRKRRLPALVGGGADDDIVEVGQEGRSAGLDDDELDKAGKYFGRGVEDMDTYCEREGLVHIKLEF